MFDCNVGLGIRGIPGYGPLAVGVPELLAEMDRLGVQQALVYSITAREVHPAVGNGLLIEELARHPEARGRLSPCWVALPNGTGEYLDPEPLLEQMAAAQVRAVRLFPGMRGHGSHRYRFHPLVLGGLLEALERHRVPVFVDFDLGRRDELPWEDLTAVCERYPDLPLVLLRPGGRSDRSLYPFLEAFPSVFLETAGYQVHDGLRAVADRFGPQRLLFGSGYPQYSWAGAAYHVAHAGLGPEALAAVAGGNLQRLLEGVVWP